MKTPLQIRALAAETHGNQMYGQFPYIAHLNAVYSIRTEYMLPVYEECAGIWAAYFHDALEDTPMTADELRDQGCPEIAVTAVQFCTDEPGETRKVRKAATYERVSRRLEGYVLKTDLGIDLGIETKVCDRLANTEAARFDNSGLFQMYRKEYPTFKKTYCLEGHLPLMWARLDELAAPAP